MKGHYFWRYTHFPLNHDYGRKGSCWRSIFNCWEELIFSQLNKTSCLHFSNFLEGMKITTKVWKRLKKSKPCFFPRIITVLQVRYVAVNDVKKTLLGGGFKDSLFSPRSLRRWSNLTCAYFSDGWFNHQLPLDPKTHGKMKVLNPQYGWNGWNSP